MSAHLTATNRPAIPTGGSSRLTLRRAPSSLPARAGSWLLRFAAAKPLGAFGLAALIALALAALAAPVIAPYDPLQTGLTRPLSPPTAAHLLGADAVGRDVLSRIIWGARTSLLVGVASVALAVVFGSLLGLLSGYRGGAFDLIAQRVIDTLQAFPSLVLALALMATLGPSLLNLIIAIVVTLIPLKARIIRGQVLALREQQYVEAARALGAGSARMLWRHILPGVLPTIIVIASIDLGQVIIIEASLSFLGLGATPPTPSWGQMLSGSAARYFRDAPLLAIFLGLAISLTVLSINFLGDALRDVLDPRLRRT
ncbi:MAG: ABC transporter permease [Chloroflexi bacterium]|nr:ABC transporter permease [Chloroflexota bacterium]